MILKFFKLHPCSDDPDVALVQNHRSFLKEHVVFKEVIQYILDALFSRWLLENNWYISTLQVIPIKDPQVLSRIHQSYRIGYIKVCHECS